MPGPSPTRPPGRGRCRSTRRRATSSATPSRPPTCSPSAEIGNVYTRIMNPTQGALEARLNSLEGGVHDGGRAARHARRRLRPGRRRRWPSSTSPGPATTSCRRRRCTAARTTCSTTRCPKLGIDVTFVDDPDDLDAVAGRGPGQHQGVLRRDDPQPEERRLRHRGRVRRRPRRGHPADHRQHGAVAVPDPPARVGRRHRRAQPDQVPRRARQLDRRGDHRRRHVRLSAPRAASRASPSPTRATTAWPSGRRSAPGRSPSRPACSCCATSGRRSRRSTPS